MTLTPKPSINTISLNANLKVASIVPFGPVQGWVVTDQITRLGVAVSIVVLAVSIRCDSSHGEFYAKRALPRLGIVLDHVFPSYVTNPVYQ